MKKIFWFLDVNAELRNHAPEIWMWGIDDQGKRVLIIDRNFSPYFYLVLNEGQDSRPVIEKINSRKAKEFPLVIKIEQARLRYFGKPVEVVKVSCRDPNVIAKYARAIAKIPGVKESLEDDIRYSIRYLIDNNVSPCSWHEIEVEEETKNLDIQVDKLYAAKLPPKIIEKFEAPNLKILGFSTIAYSAKGSPRPEKNPVVVISVATNDGADKQFVARDLSDKPVLEAFVRYVREFDPDVIVGYGINRKDWVYLATRAKRLGVNLFVGRVNTEPHMSVYGHVSIGGRANVDLFDFSDELPEVKVKTLESVADFLDVMKLDKRMLIEEVDFASHWEDNEKRPNLLRFSKENTQSVMGIGYALLDFAVQLSSLVGLPLDHVGTAAVGFRIESFLMRQAYKIGELIPKRVERPYLSYAGSVVLAPKQGVHENIAVLDFKSMYPSIMITQNVSPDTYIKVSELEPESDVNVAPEVGHHFRKEPSGFYKEVLSNLIAFRDQIRPKLGKLDTKSQEYKVLDARQKAMKVITNAAYGYTGWIGARWYIKPVAEAVTAWGRHVILNTIETAERIGLNVVYSDTDSVFVNNDSEKIEKLSEKVGKALGLKINPDKVYTRILFTEAKKKYCGLLPDGRLHIVGLEVVRGDWANCARDVQEKVLELILKEKKPEEGAKKAAEYVEQYISRLRLRKVPYRDVIIWKTLTKPVEEYAVKAPHVEAAKLLLKNGWALSTSDKMGYVITVGSGKLYAKARPYFLTTYDKVDIEYYIRNQVLPAASRILALFKVPEQNLLPSTETKF